MENRERIIDNFKSFIANDSFNTNLYERVADYLESTNWSDLKSQFAYEEGQRVERLRIAKELQAITEMASWEVALPEYIEKLEEKL